MENVNNSVVILGYKERVGLLNPDVSILKNGILIGTVERRGRCQLDIKEACELTFKMDNPVAQLIGRPTTCRVNPGDQILLSYNTFTGKLVAQLTDNNNLQQTIERNTKKEKKGRIVGIVVAIILAAVYFGIVQPLSLSPSSSSSSSSSYKEEIKALGFPTNEIDYWIDNAMDIRDFSIGVVDIWGYQMIKALNFGPCALEYETFEEGQVKFYTQALCDVIENLQ